MSVPLTVPTFDVTFQPLREGVPALGRVALLPWDTQTFGFAVGVYELGDAPVVVERMADFQSALNTWARAYQVELISCTAPGDHFVWHALLAQSGFTAVDFSLRGDRDLRTGPELPEVRAVLRLATPDDEPAVLRLAQGAFRFGRYHSDPRFPKLLARRRFRHWMANALKRVGKCERVYVVGPPGTVTGFYHALLVDTLADLRLAAIDRQAEGRIAGKDLYAATLQALQADGASRATGKISAANVPVVNVFAALGFRFSNPEVVFHWHAPDAAHLVPLKDNDSIQPLE